MGFGEIEEKTFWPDVKYNNCGESNDKDEEFVAWISDSARKKYVRGDWTTMADNFEKTMMATGNPFISIALA